MKIGVHFGLYYGGHGMYIDHQFVADVLIFIVYNVADISEDVAYPRLIFYQPYYQTGTV